MNRRHFLKHLLATTVIVATPLKFLPKLPQASGYLGAWQGVNFIDTTLPATVNVHSALTLKMVKRAIKLLEQNNNNNW